MTKALLFLPLFLIGNLLAEEGLALRPAVILIQGVAPGQAFDMQTASGHGFVLINRSSAEAPVAGIATAPPGYHPSQYERGYEPPPRLDWFNLQPAAQLLQPGGEFAFSLKANIPDDPAFYNRHWMLYVESGPDPSLGLGAAIRLRARVLFETTPAPRQPGAPPAAIIDIAPSVVAMQQLPDGSWSGQTAIGNGAEETATFDLLRVADIFSTKLGRAHRYFPDPREAVLTEQWAYCKQESWNLTADAWQELQLQTSKQELSAPREEVLFIARRVADTNEAVSTHKGQAYDRFELLRLVYLP